MAFVDPNTQEVTLKKFDINNIDYLELTALRDSMDIAVAELINDYGSSVMMVGLGYFIYYVWWFIGEHINPT